MWSDLEVKTKESTTNKNIPIPQLLTPILLSNFSWPYWYQRISIDQHSSLNCDIATAYFWVQPEANNVEGKPRKCHGRAPETQSTSETQENNGNAPGSRRSPKLHPIPKQGKERHLEKVQNKLHVRETLGKRKGETC